MAMTALPSLGYRGWVAHLNVIRTHRAHMLAKMIQSITVLSIGFFPRPRGRMTSSRWGHGRARGTPLTCRLTMSSAAIHGVFMRFNGMTSIISRHKFP